VGVGWGFLGGVFGGGGGGGGGGGAGGASWRVGRWLLVTERFRLESLELKSLS
jgi:hypothetical protein